MSRHRLESNVAIGIFERKVFRKDTRNRCVGLQHFIFYSASGRNNVVGTCGSFHVSFESCPSLDATTMKLSLGLFAFTVLGISKCYGAYGPIQLAERNGNAAATTTSVSFKPTAGATAAG